MKAGAVVALLLACAFGIVACGSTEIDQPHMTTPTTSAAPVPVFTTPDVKWVSTMEPGQSFWAVPNYFYFDACGPDPCGLGVQPSPDSPRGTPFILTEDAERTAILREPNEFAGPTLPPDMTGNVNWVFVVCQVIGPVIQDDRGAVSQTNIWNRVSIPYWMLKPEAIAAQRLELGQSGVGYVSDLWLENTGDHQIPCPSDS